MAIERTLCIIKPDAVAQGATGEILRRVEAEGLAIIALKRIQLSEREAYRVLMPYQIPTSFSYGLRLSQWDRSIRFMGVTTH